MEHNAQPQSAHQRLLDLGLNIPLLHEILSTGLRKRQEASDLHPNGAGGSFQYHETNAAMAHLLGLRGWMKLDEENVRILVSPDGTVGVITSSGEEGVGRVGGHPIKRSVGNKTIEMVAENGYVQARLDGIRPLGATRSSRGTDRTIWMLLYYWDERTETLFSELSRAVGLGPNDGTHNVLNCPDRFILPPLTLDNLNDLSQNHEHAEDENEEPDIDIDISRRTS